jgi:hypothetical protein
MVTSWLCKITRGRRVLGSTSLLLLGHFVALAQANVPSAASVAPAARVAPVEAAPTTTALNPNAPTPAAGSWTLVKNLTLPSVGAASIDRRGTLYLTDRDNNLRQLSRDGQPLNT